MQPAPLYEDVADAPPGGAAHWLTTGDGTRIRVGHWAPEGARGTVLMFPGRTEYIEKYGRVAGHFSRAGLALMAVDWRGQGLSARLTGDPNSGYVVAFRDYQQDVAAMVAAADAADLPHPRYLLGHSMGGGIGLRALMEGLEVKAAAFSAPMWGITLGTVQRPFAYGLAAAAKAVGLDHHYAPGTRAESYIENVDFDENQLTNDPDQLAWMSRQTQSHPDLALGGPSLRWLGEALRETDALAKMPSPDVPCLTLLGTDEKIVDPARIKDRMERWPGGRLEVFDGGRHEVLMETRERREKALGMIVERFG